MESEAPVVLGSSILRKVMQLEDEWSLPGSQPGNQVRELGVFSEGWIVEVPAVRLCPESDRGCADKLLM